MTDILVVDDHEVVREGLRGIFEGRGWHVVAAPNGGRAIQAAEAIQPDVVVVDYSLPDMNGVDVTRRVREILPQTEVLIFTLHNSPHIVRDALKAGALGYVVKSDDSRHLVRGVKALLKHQPYFTIKASKARLGDHVQPILLEAEASQAAERDDEAQELERAEAVGRLARLSPREKAVLEGLVDGKSNKMIAFDLNISPRTVEIYRSKLMNKTSVGSLSKLVRLRLLATGFRS